MKGLILALALLASFLQADRKPPLLVSLADQAEGVPSDETSRAKFPDDPAALIDGLSFVNRYVNSHMQGMSDKEQYGRDELWVMFPESAKGDCDDFMLTKLGILSEAGFPVVTQARVQTVLVHLKGRDPEGHVVLEVLLPSGAIAVLDNRFADLMTEAELRAEGYEFIQWG